MAGSIVVMVDQTAVDVLLVLLAPHVEVVGAVVAKSRLQSAIIIKYNQKPFQTMKRLFYA